jgi:hypothetical protein
MLRRVAHVRTDVSEERNASIILHSVRRLLVIVTLFLARRLLSLCWWTGSYKSHTA